MMKYRLLAPLALALICGACVTNIHPDVASNPPPTEALSDFQHFELMPATISDQAAHEDKAFAKIKENLQLRVAPLIASWEGRNQSGRVLRIEPHIDQLKFVSGNGRFWAGDMAGSSAVVLHLKLTNVATGQVIADPEFYQRAAAEGGMWSFGGTDNAMLARIATVAQEYLQRNYSQAVGGPTGLESSEN